MHGEINIFAALIALIVVGYPTSRILRRMGYSGWWTLATLVPILNLIQLWYLAFSDWPDDRR